jgi:hypothetical protein
MGKHKRRTESSASNAVTAAAKNSWPYLLWSMILRTTIAVLMVITVIIKTTECVYCEEAHPFTLGHANRECLGWTFTFYIINAWIIALLTLAASILALIGVINDRYL